MENEIIKKSILNHAILDFVVALVLAILFVLDKMWIEFWSHSSSILLAIIIMLDLVMSIVYFVKWKKS